MDLSASSELQETAALLGRFRSRGRMLVLRTAFSATASVASSTGKTAKPLGIGGSISKKEAATARPAPSQHTGADPGRKAASAPAVESKGGRIEEILETMCLRGRFHGAVVADRGGLAVAEYNCPVETDAVAACSSILGSAMERAGILLEQQDANHISLDINYVDKVVLRQFVMEGLVYYLMIICPQEVDERSELELSIDRVIGVLSRRS